MNYNQLQSLVDDSAILKLTNCILADLKTHYPFIKTIEAYEGQLSAKSIKRVSASPHAIFLSVINAPSSKPTQRGNREFTVTITAYVLAINVKGISHAKASIAISESLASLIHFQRWSGWVGKQSYPQDVKISKVQAEALNQVGASVMALTWSCNIDVGADLTENPEGAPDRLKNLEIGTMSFNGAGYDEVGING